ncbi:MAG: hypothetical protein E6R07_06055 [Nevskiaceae bacterium]|nr:MAG: hypothetical protein E6R07_06055 [Nevskiaceae bacterium]
MRLGAWVGAVTLAVAPLAALADESTDWLVKLSDAARTASYQGIIVYRGSDILETFRVAHRNQNGTELERVQSLNGEPRDILKENDRVICLLPRDRRVSINRPTPKGLFPALSPERLKQIAAVYEFDDLGSARVAGRNCHGIAITPRDQFRYGYEIWADTQTAVPLKVNLIGRDGTMMEQMMFTEVDFPASIPDTAFEMPKPDGDRIERVMRDPASVPSPPVAPPTPETVAWDVDHLPPGFHVTLRELRTLPNNAGTVEHLLISDGLSAISIFSAHRTSQAKPLNGVSQIGAVNAYGRMVGSFHITVVGEAPPETVKMIGDGLKPVQAADKSPADGAKPQTP